MSPSISQYPTGSSYPSTTPKHNCFETPVKLYNAVSEYLESGANSQAANIYGSPIGTWCVGKITDMGGLFQGSTFNEDISNWDVANVVNMEEMFKCAIVSIIKMM